MSVRRPSRRSHADLLAVALLTVAAIGVSLASVDVLVIRALLGVPLAILLPGYALCSAALPRLPTGAEALAFVIGVSLAATALTGLVINLLPGGLDVRSWAVALGVVTLAATGGALLRRRGSQRLSASRRARLPRLDVGPAILVGLATLVLAGAIVVARAGAVHQRNQVAFTQLSMLPARAGRSTVTLGIANHEGARKRYRLVLTEGSLTVREWPSIELGAGGQWKSTVTALTAPGVRKLRATLFREGHGQAYRHVDLPTEALP